VAEQFPEAARHVVQALAEVYKHDAQCRKQAYSPEQRLLFHQQHSQPVIEDLHTWITGQMQGKHVEPNSPLGKALNYLIKHWSELTLFLRKVGAPLDNNLCEQILKRAIIHRKGSLFYKTVRGAEVGDIYMSLEFRTKPHTDHEPGTLARYAACSAAWLNKALVHWA
jgi:hypothetical protein